MEYDPVFLYIGYGLATVCVAMVVAIVYSAIRAARRNITYVNERRIHGSRQRGMVGLGTRTNGGATKWILM